MSRVYFHTPSGGAELLGSERAYAASVVRAIAVGLLRISHNYDRLAGLVRPGHYLTDGRQNSPEWRTWFETAFTVDDGDPNGSLLVWQGLPLDSFTLQLNTAQVIGNDQVRFLARLHGQCEVHGWVDGPNRAWLAGLINVGVSNGLYRDGAGWDKVAALLRDRDDEPVVMSYSVCDSFPAESVADWSPTLDADGEPVNDDEWYELAEDERWRLAMAGLRTGRGRLELSPVGFASYYFGDGLSVLDLLAQDWETRLTARLAS